MGGVIAAPACEGRHHCMELALCPYQHWFVLVEALFLVGGVTVHSVKEHCQLVNLPKAKQNF